MAKFPKREVIDYVYDQGTDGDVTANDEVTANDYTTIEGDHELDTDEVIEVERIEMLPPVNDDGSLDTFDYLRLHDGNGAYPHLRYREFMMGFKGPSFGIRTPKLGEPVLENKHDPSSNPFLTATPKFGPNTVLHPRLQNDGTAINQSFRVRLHVWRFSGTEEELRGYFGRAGNLNQNINQGFGVSNPFRDEGEQFSKSPVDVSSQARRGRGSGKAHNQFSKLTGGVDQSFPKVWPWATWATNAKATTANRKYQFSFALDNVDDRWQNLHFDFSDGEDAAIFDYIMVDEEETNLETLYFQLDSRDSDHIPEFTVTPNDAHELPFIRRPSDGTSPSADEEDVPTKVSDILQRSETMVWNDGGGIAVEDDGTSIASGEILIGVQGRYMELEAS